LESRRLRVTRGFGQPVGPTRGPHVDAEQAQLHAPIVRVYGPTTVPPLFLRASSVLSELEVDFRRRSHNERGGPSGGGTRAQPIRRVLKNPGPRRGTFRSVDDAQGHLGSLGGAISRRLP